MTREKTRHSSPKTRIDLLMVEKGLVKSRQQAQKFILAGAVLANNKTVRKTGELFDPDVSLELIAKHSEYVSRGGEKIAHALDTFQLNVTDLVCVDIGISTGGFTDCLLQRGAKHVFGIDVGYGQVAWQLRQHKRLTLFERTNIRYFDTSLLNTLLDLAVIDVSFISLKKIVGIVHSMLKLKGYMLALIKPQFEVGKGKVGKGGIVKDPQLHDEVLADLHSFITQHGFCVLGSCASPITGAKGNKEFFILATPRERNV